MSRLKMLKVLRAIIMDARVFEDSDKYHEGPPTYTVESFLKAIDYRIEKLESAQGGDY